MLVLVSLLPGRLSRTKTLHSEMTFLGALHNSHVENSSYILMQGCMVSHHQLNFCGYNLTATLSSSWLALKLQLLFKLSFYLNKNNKIKNYTETQFAA